jgi:hypothetical protein
MAVIIMPILFVLAKYWQPSSKRLMQLEGRYFQLVRNWREGKGPKSEVEQAGQAYWMAKGLPEQEALETTQKELGLI